jgi:hypothetical protein
LYLTSFDRYKVFEETVRIELIKMASVNKTVFRLLNDDPADNNYAFGMGYFDNLTEEFDEDIDDQYYEINNYYINNTHDYFQLRGIFNCTKVLRDTNADPAPPCGPLNETNVFFGEELDWAGNTTVKLVGSGQNTGTSIYVNFTVDDTVLWHTTVNHTLVDGFAGTPVTVYGVTYRSPKINFSDYPADQYVCKVRAKKPGFETYEVDLILNIWEQETAAYNISSGEEINLSGNPLKVTTPRWNQTSVIFHLNDTTNAPPKEQELDISFVDSIEIITDGGNNIYRNDTGLANSWTGRP